MGCEGEGREHGLATAVVAAKGVGPEEAGGAVELGGGEAGGETAGVTEI